MPRSSVYGFLETLIQRGVVQEEFKGKIKNFTCAHPRALISMIETEKAELGKREFVAERLMGELTSFMNRSQQDLPKLLHFEGKKEIEDMLFEYAPLWQKSCEKIGDLSLWGYQDHIIVDQYRDWQQYIWEFRDPRFKIRLFSSDEGVEQQVHERIPNREIRPLPEGFDFESTIWVRGEYVIMIRTREKPHYAVMLYDPVFSANHRRIFELLWQTTAAQEFAQ